MIIRLFKENLRVLISLVIIGVALVLLFYPGLLNLDSILQSVDNRLLFLVPLAMIFIMAAWNTIIGRGYSGFSMADPEDTEYPRFRDTEFPGSDIDNVLQNDVRKNGSEYSFLINELRELAAKVIHDRERVPKQEALQLVEEGEWTENKRAAWFLHDRHNGTIYLPLTKRFMDWLDPSPTVCKNFEAVMEELSDNYGFSKKWNTDLIKDGLLDQINENGPKSRPFSIKTDLIKTQAEKTAEEEFEEGSLEEKYIHRTGRWNTAITAAIVTGLLALVFTQPVFIMAAIACFMFVAYASLSEPIEPNLQIEHVFSKHSPLPGDHVRVTVKIKNNSNSILPDVRIIDGVPEKLGVIKGSPRYSTTLLSGEEESFSYTIRAKRGVNEFRNTTVLIRNFTGTYETEYAINPSKYLECGGFYESYRISKRTLERAGEIPTNTGGSGIEFHSSREYKQGDPINRIDWKHLSKTGELTTVNFQEKRSMSLMLFADMRELSRVANHPGGTSAAALNLYASEKIACSLIEEGSLVGIHFFPYGRLVLPDTGPVHQNKLLKALKTVNVDRKHKAHDDYIRSDFFSDYVKSEFLHSDIPNRTQVMVLSPALDDSVVEICRVIDANGYPVILFSPDVTDPVTPGRHLESIKRSVRFDKVRSMGISVVDWPLDQTIDVALSNKVWGNQL